MKVLCTFPGRYGDLLWALPTMRALSRRLGETVDLLIAGEFASLVPLLEQQLYLGKVHADPEWPLHPNHREAPNRGDVISPYDLTLHLGYRGWPQRPLPFETLDCLNTACDVLAWRTTQTHAGLRWDMIPDEELRLDQPWITLSSPSRFGTAKFPWCYGFSEAHFELKYGVLQLLTLKPYWWPVYGLPPVSVGAGDRWYAEAGNAPCTWVESAGILLRSQAFLGCCSALHVLAVACGTPCVVMEPMEARWNPIFYPLGMEGPQLTVVTGNDGKPTFDSRHVRDTLKAVSLSRKAIT